MYLEKNNQWCETILAFHTLLLMIILSKVMKLMGTGKWEDFCSFENPLNFSCKFIYFDLDVHVCYIVSFGIYSLFLAKNTVYLGFC